jgi:hypothetical protein
LSRISACPDPRAFGLIFTPIIFHRRTWPSRKRSAHEFGGPCLRGSWVEKDGQTMSILRGFWVSTPDCDPCTASVASRDRAGRSCHGLCLFQDLPDARAQMAGRNLPLHRSPGVRLRVPCPFMGLIHRSYRGEQAMPPTARCELDLPSTYRSDRCLAASRFRRWADGFQLLRPRSAGCSFLFEVLHRSHEGFDQRDQ